MPKIRVVSSREIEVEATTPEERELFIGAGLVNITGFYMETERGIGGKSDFSTVGSRLRQEELGTYGVRSGFIAVVTRDGEVWFGAMMPANELKIARVIDQLKLRQGAYVPFSRSGEKGPDARALLKRLADPDCDPHKSYDGN